MEFVKNIVNDIIISEIQKELNNIKNEIKKFKKENLEVEKEENIKKLQEELLKKIKP
jgi:hypothetical protein